MNIETEAIVLKQTKIAGGRRMVVLFSKHYGKISSGTSISERGKSRAALALRPFVYGKYQIKKINDYYYINGGEAISSHYAIGEDVDKYLCASYGMEVTGKLLPEDAPDPKLFLLFSEFLDTMEKRSKKYETILIAYLMKVLDHMGNSPCINSCVICGSKDKPAGFDVEEGGILCEPCFRLAQNNQRLIYNAEFDIVNVINFLIRRPLSEFDNLALDDGALRWLQKVFKSYIDCHLGISSLKSEEYMKGVE